MKRQWVTLAVALWVVAAADLVSMPSLAQTGSTDAETPRRRVLTRAPKLVRFVEAPYPEAEKATGRTGSTLLQLAITAEGAVQHVVVLASAGPAFDEAAMAAARQFVFEPAEIDGKPAPVKITYRYDFVFKPEKKTTADFTGVVRDRKTGNALAGVSVRLATGQAAVTDVQGRFRIVDVTPGKINVMLIAPNLTPVGTAETFEEGKELDAVYDLETKPVGKPGAEADDFEVVVVTAQLDKKVVSTEVTTEQSRFVPGAQGDVLKVVENLPGVARAAVGSAQLVVWGAAPQDTRVYVNGVRIPALYHEGGLRSVIHTDLVRTVELAPGGYGSAFGRGLGGLITVQLRPLDENVFHGAVAADLIDASGAIRVPITDRIHVAVAARRSHLDWMLSRATSRDVGEFVPIPTYYDVQGRIGYNVGPSEHIEAGTLLSSDTISRNLTSQDPADTKRESKQMGFERVYVRYDKRLSDGAAVEVVPWVGKDHSKISNRFGTVPAEMDVDSWVYGLRATWKGHAAPWLNSMVGLDAEIVSSTLTRSGSITSPPREGDIRVFGQPPADQVNADRWDAAMASLAPFTELDFGLVEDRLHVIPGIRFEPYLVQGSRLTPAQGETPAIGFTRQEIAMEPRLSVRFAATDRITAKAAIGRYHQGPQPEDLSAVFGNPLLGLAMATHYLAGSTFRVLEKTNIETTVFLSRSDDLVIRNPSPSPLLAQALVQGGQGRAYGIQILVRQDLTDRFFGWLSYSIMRSERTDVPDGNYRLFDYDQTHVLTGLVSYNLGRGFDVGGRVRCSTGYPRTPVVGAYYDSRHDIYQPLFGAHNATRVPPFYQIDLRAAKRFKIDWSELEVYLDLQNVSNRSNPEEIVYNYNFTQRGYITGLPLLPVLGARWSW